MPFVSLVCLVAVSGPGLAADPQPAARPADVEEVTAHDQGVLAFRRGDYAQAARWFTEALAASPQDPRTLAFLASCHEELNEPDSARDRWRQVASVAGTTRLGALAAIRLQALAGRLPSTNRSVVSASALSRVESKRVTARTEHFVVDAYNRELATYVAERAEGDLESIRAQVLGTSLYPHTVRIRIFPNAAVYEATVGAPHWSGGGFLVDARPDGTMRREVHLVQRDAEGRFNDRLLDVELPHELSHVVVDEFFGQRRCPVWLDEALAMMAERRPDAGRAEVVALAVRFGTYAPLPKLLDRSDWPPDYPTSLLYAQAESVGRFLWARLGDAGGRDLLAQLRSGEAVRAALARALPVNATSPLNQLEESWIRFVTDEPSEQ